MPPHKRPNAAATKAKHAEIAARYKKGQRKPPSWFHFSTRRISDLNRLLRWRFGTSIPKTKWGREHARVMLHHLAYTKDAGERCWRFADLWCWWMPHSEIRKILDKPMRWNASHLGALLSVTPDERERLVLTTIGARGTTKDEREAARKQRHRDRQRAKRRVAGMKPRRQYEDESLSRRKPWEADDVSRRTWERRRRKGMT